MTRAVGDETVDNDKPLDRSLANVRKRDAGGRYFVTPSDEPPSPTSCLLQTIFDHAPASVSLDWLFRKLRQRSFGLVMLFLGLFATIPGVGVLGGLGLAVLSFQMLMAYEAPILPRFVAQRPLPTDRVSRLVNRAVPVIRMLERFVRPRWQAPFTVTKRLVGFVMLLLAATMFIPIPLSNVLPGAMAMLVAFMYLEQDGAFLALALTASVCSLLISATEIWGSVAGANFLFRL
jgi:hypothetical protein